MMKTYFFVVVALVQTTALAAQTQSPSPGVDEKQIVIGSCAALDGANRMGVQVIIGGTAYLHWINDQGGLNGRKIQLLAFDDGYEPSKAETCFKRLQKEGVFAAGFFVGTPTAGKYVPLAEENQLPIVGLFTGAEFLYDPIKPHVFNIRASYRDEIGEEVDYAWNALNLRRIGIIYQDDALGQDAVEGLRLALKRYHATTTGMGTFARNSTDVSEGLKAVRKASPQAVLIVGPFGQAAEVVKQAHSQGWRPLFMTLSAAGSEKFIAAAGTEAEGVIISEVLPSYNRTDLKTVALYHQILKKYFPDAEPNALSLEGFIDATVLVEGLRRAGKKLTRDGLVHALESLHNYDLGLGPRFLLDYSRSRHKGVNSVNLTIVSHGIAVAMESGKESLVSNR